MNIELISHIKEDEDLLYAWFRYYVLLGVTTFHIIVHGTERENKLLFDLMKEFPAIVEYQYEGEFKIEQKKDYINECIKKLRHSWVVIVDSDEFIELPFINLNATIQSMKKEGANTLFCPMVQHIKKDGSLHSPAIIKNPFKYFPLCSVDLYKQLGVKASTSKFPLFYCKKTSILQEGGNHISPNGIYTSLSKMQGVTHHFKWKQSILKRLQERANSSHTFKNESVQYLDYLKKNNNRLPLLNCFKYSRSKLFDLGLLNNKNNHKIFDYNINWKDEYEKNISWLKNLHRLKTAIDKNISASENYILIDEGQLLKEFYDDKRLLPFMENNGTYWGLPTTSIIAINEVERLKNKGAQFLILAWTAWWWKNYYVTLFDYLEQKYFKIYSSKSLIIFQLEDFGLRDKALKKLSFKKKLI